MTQSLGLERIVGIQHMEGAQGHFLSRSAMCFLAVAIVSANALLANVFLAIGRNGTVAAVANTFDVSAIVWVGLYLCLKLLASAERESATIRDKVVFTGLVFVCAIPLGQGTWVISTALAAYILLTSEPRSVVARAGWILLAITFPMFWSKRLFAVLSEYLLQVDAFFVSSITHTEQVGNLVAIPGGGGYLQIAAPCSSMGNISLALLTWVLFTQTMNVSWTYRNLLWCGSAALAVVVINVSRISLIGFFPQYFDLLHGPVGTTVVSWLIIVVVTAICYHGVRNVGP